MSCILLFFKYGHPNVGQKIVANHRASIVLVRIVTCWPRCLTPIRPVKRSDRYLELKVLNCPSIPLPPCVFSDMRSFKIGLTRTRGRNYQKPALWGSITEDNINDIRQYFHIKTRYKQYEVLYVIPYNQWFYVMIFLLNFASYLSSNTLRK